MKHLTRIETCEAERIDLCGVKELIRRVMHRYYEGGLSSVYLWDQEDGGFAGVILIKKGLYVFRVLDMQLIGLSYRCIGSKPSQSGNHGAWDSIHTLEVHERGRQAQYKIVSTTMLWVGNTANDEEGAEGNVVSLSGTMTRDVSFEGLDSRKASRSKTLSLTSLVFCNVQLEQTKNLAKTSEHIPNIGRLIEEQEYVFVTSTLLRN
ncbi:hypothetical protein QFC19_002627 [Naganishia cerealis]|uniref:Uncharacterized protein n=1 Tax=Naganishia cerealis TaxID=610337 RepID=A0ACC2W9J4_9TREE|nr:hypothetical protein QFC19_002627 [Naganishia cerealis]